MKWINVDVKWADDFINHLIDNHGYDPVQAYEGGCGVGDWIMIPPDEKTMYYFIIREVYLNEWSSGQQYMKCRKLPKKWESRIQRLTVPCP